MPAALFSSRRKTSGRPVKLCVATNIDMPPDQYERAPRRCDGPYLESREAIVGLPIASMPARAVSARLYMLCANGRVPTPSIRWPSK